MKFKKKIKIVKDRHLDLGSWKAKFADGKAAAATYCLRLAL